jgi:hypothetical protein
MGAIVEFGDRLSLRDEDVRWSADDPGFADSPGAKLAWPIGPQNSGEF